MFGWISHMFVFLEQGPLHTDCSSMAALRDNNRHYVPASAHTATKHCATELGGSSVMQNLFST